MQMMRFEPPHEPSVDTLVAEGRLEVLDLVDVGFAEVEVLHNPNCG